MWLIINALFLIISVSQCKIVILSPQGLKDKFKDTNSTIDVVYGNFGHIPYGQSLTGQVYFNASNPLGCNQEDIFLDELKGKPKA